MKRFFIWFFVAALAMPFLLVGTFYGVENLTGSLAWNSALGRMKSLGQPLVLEDIRPATIPDDRNMAATPIFRELFALPDARRADLHALQLPGASGPFDAPEIIRLARRFHGDFTGDAAAAARVVADGIAPMADTLQRLSQAAARPEAVWPIDFNQGFKIRLPFLAPLRQATEVLAARGLAALSRDEPAAALADFLLITDLATRSNQPSFLANALAEQSMLEEAVRLMERGAADRIWSETQLALIESRLAELAPLQSFADSVRGERVLFLAAADQLDLRAASLFAMIDASNDVSESRTRLLSNVLWQLRPAGWNARDRARYLTLSQEYLDEVIRHGAINPEAVAAWNARIRAIRRDRFELLRTPLTVLTLPAFGAAARRAAFAQTRIDQARVACALERFRLRHGHLPERLGELKPDFLEQLPRDVIGGRHLVFTRTSPNTYQLYSRGWNGNDNGGIPNLADTSRPPLDQSDWVWNALIRF